MRVLIVPVILEAVAILVLCVVYCSRTGACSVPVGSICRTTCASVGAAPNTVRSRGEPGPPPAERRYRVPTVICRPLLSVKGIGP